MALTLLDTNVLVHAAYRGSPLHDVAARLVQRGLDERGVFCITPQNLVEFAAVVTRPRHVSPPMSGSDVQRITAKLYESRKLLKIYPQRATASRALKFGTQNGISGPRWYDVFLVFTMADANVTDIVTDNARDFAGFSFLRVQQLHSPA